jgi:hypothetical protein
MQGSTFRHDSNTPTLQNANYLRGPDYSLWNAVEHFLEKLKEK